MCYRGYGVVNGGVNGLLRRISTTRKTLRDEWRSLRRLRNRSGHLAAVDITRPLVAGDVPLMAGIRNEMSHLPAFLAHYRALGVTRFLIVDDRSEDGTAEFLARQPDVDLYTSELRFREAELGVLWYQELACRHGLDRWYLVVDADEYLVYEGMDRHRLPDLIRSLERRGLKRLLAPMIDLYPSMSLAQAGHDPQRMPWEIADHFDASGYSMSAGPYGPVIYGGGMNRVFGNEIRQKLPSVFWDRRTSYYKTIHFPLPYSYSPYRVFGVLLHFKCFSNLGQRALAAIADNQHYGDAVAYRRYHQVVEADANLCLMSEDSIRYEGPDQLVRLGFMEPIGYD